MNTYEVAKDLSKTMMDDISDQDFQDVLVKLSREDKDVVEDRLVAIFMAAKNTEGVEDWGEDFEIEEDENNVVDVEVMKDDDK